jgi:hypothetical protein
MVLLCCALCLAQDSTQSSGAEKSYVIENPGTITFKVGAKIKGKVEKPQVLIFLPKEKPLQQPPTFERSFRADLLQQLPFDPVLE